MFDELSQTIKSALYERVVSPLLGYFAVSWALWNFKFLMVILSSEPVLRKLEIIHRILYPGWEVTVLFSGVFPLLTALALIFLYPYPARYVFKFWRNQQKAIMEIKRLIDEETPISIEQARALRRSAFQLEAELDKRNDENRALRKELSEALSKLDTKNLNNALLNSTNETTLQPEHAKTTTSQQKYEWEEEYKLEMKGNAEFVESMKDMVRSLADDAYPNPRSTTYLIANGLVSKTANNRPVLTEKGQYLAKYAFR